MIDGKGRIRDGKGGVRRRRRERGEREGVMERGDRL